MGTGNSSEVNFTAETILKWTIGPLSSRDNTTIAIPYRKVTLKYRQRGPSLSKMIVLRDRPVINWSPTRSIDDRMNRSLCS